MITNDAGCDRQRGLLPLMIASATFAFALTLSPLLAEEPRANPACPLTAPAMWRNIIVPSAPAKVGVPVDFATALPPIPDCAAPLPGHDIPTACIPHVYEIQSCDTVQWTFGDGSAPLIRPASAATHTYEHAGLYQVALRITNDLGTYEVRRDVYIATIPETRIGALDPEVHESARSVAVHITRSGDLSHVNAVSWRLFANDNRVMRDSEGTFAFQPGQPDQIVVLPVTSDGAYARRGYTSYLNMTLAADGAVTMPPGSDFLHLTSTIHVLEDQAEPSASVSDVVVEKGTDVARVPIELSAPLAHVCCLEAFRWRTIERSARAGVDYIDQPDGWKQIEPDTTHGFLDVPLSANSQRGTRSFDIELYAPTIPLTRTRATVTIEDAAPLLIVPIPTALSVAVGASAPLTLSLSSVGTDQVPVNLSSSDPDVATVSGPLVMAPGGFATAHVAGRKAGRATITVTPAGGQASTVAVEVTASRRRAS